MLDWTWEGKGKVLWFRYEVMGRVDRCRSSAMGSIAVSCAWILVGKGGPRKGMLADKK
jgi:hypothetical protein